MAGLALGERAGHRPGGPALWRLAGLVGLGGCLLVWLVLLGPLGALLAHLRPSVVGRALSAPGALGPLVTSLEASALALALLVVLGTPLAWAMARDRLPAPRIIEAGVLVPLLMPPLVIGLLLVFLAGPATPVGRALGLVHLSASDTFFALVLAELYEAGPYYVLGVAAAVRSVDPELEAQAALLGDPWPRVARRVTLPLAAPGVASTLAVAWARAIGAFGAVIIVAYHPYGLPMQIWVTLEEQGLPAALPFALVLLVVALPLPLLGLLWAARAQRAAQAEPLEVPG